MDRAFGVCPKARASCGEGVVCPMARAAL
jgi:hypothetical protein